jgi:hypothetical protein
LLATIGIWFMFNAFLVVAAINDKLQSWVSFLFGASVVIGLVICSDGGERCGKAGTRIPAQKRPALGACWHTTDKEREIRREGGWL